MKKSIRIIYISICFICLILAGYAIHDMQTSEGIGFYYALKFNKDRKMFDLLADAFFFLLLLFAVSIPCLVSRINARKTKKTASNISFSRFSFIFLALIPSIHTNYVFDLFHDRTMFSIHTDINGFLDGLLENFRVALPILILLTGMLAINQVQDRSIFKLIIAALIIEIIFIPFAGLSNLASFVSAYLLIIAIAKSMSLVQINLFAMDILFAATGIYKIINVCMAASM